MKTLIALACLTALSAHATNYPAPQPTGLTQNVGITSIAAALGVGQGGAGGSGGAGGTSSSSLLNSGNGTGITGGTFGGSGGAGGTIGAGAGSLNLAGASIGSPTITTPKQVGAVAGGSPPQTIGSCRVWLSVFGAKESGTGGGVIPLWRDDDCLRGAAKAHMQRTNEQYIGTYNRDDFLRVDCKIDTLAETQACKELAAREAEVKRAEAVLNDRPMASSSLQLLP